MKKKSGLIGDGFLDLRMPAKKRARSYLAKMKNITLDTQAVRAKLLSQLDGLFDLAVCIAKGKVKQLRDEDGNE